MKEAAADLSSLLDSLPFHCIQLSIHLLSYSCIIIHLYNNNYCYRAQTYNYGMHELLQELCLGSAIYNTPTGIYIIILCKSSHIQYMYMCPTKEGSSFFLGKVTALGVPCCFALFVCLTLLASFFLPSHLSLKHV